MLGSNADFSLNGSSAEMTASCEHNPTEKVRSEPASLPQQEPAEAHAPVSSGASHSSAVSESADVLTAASLVGPDKPVSVRLLQRQREIQSRRETEVMADDGSGHATTRPLRKTGAQEHMQDARAKAHNGPGLHRQLRKTKFCMFHLQGVCQFGENCAFAHGCEELQGAPDLRNTKLCKDKGACQERRCPYAHNEEELRSTGLFYKRALCIWHQKGKCRNGEMCRFAHGSAEQRMHNHLRGKKSASSAEGAGAVGLWARHIAGHCFAVRSVPSSPKHRRGSCNDKTVGASTVVVLP
eukprot:s551_g3.t1